MGKKQSTACWSPTDAINVNETENRLLFEDFINALPDPYHSDLRDAFIIEKRKDDPTSIASRTRDILEYKGKAYDVIRDTDLYTLMTDVYLDMIQDYALMALTCGTGRLSIMKECVSLYEERNFQTTTVGNAGCEKADRQRELLKKLFETLNDLIESYKEII